MSSLENVRILFITGRLAERSLRRVVTELAATTGILPEVAVLPISVAALMTADWIARHLEWQGGADRVIIPGWCGGDLAPIAARCGAPVERGPRDLRQLPAYLSGQPVADDYGAYDIEIIAEINHAPRLATEDLCRTAARLRADGADVIDVGCEPGGTWRGVGDAVKALRDAGLRVSIDSLNPAEIEPAVRAGAELVLSVNRMNLEAAADWGCEVVVIPDEPRDWTAMERSIEWLTARGVPLRVDPILEPIGLGLAASLARYAAARTRWPDTEIMMGIGNVTELTDVDSAGLNVLLLAIAQELAIRSVLTTEVIGWARTSVRECDIARRLAWYAINRQLPPKNLDGRLVVLRDPAVPPPLADDEYADIARQVRDWNVRIFADGSLVQAIAAGHHWRAGDPFEVFDQMAAAAGPRLTPSHAFYLGYEMCKAAIANHLGKAYVQDEALRWGYLTVPEATRHRLSRRGTKSDVADPPAENPDAS
jgi:dihydropteroate synthase